MVILPVDERALDRAAEILAEGDVVALPTDTVYGLAVDAFRPGATERLFTAKRRPHDVDLPVLVADPDDVHRLAAEVPPLAAAFIERWWPGPLTIVFTRRPHLDLDLGANATTVGVRCPEAAVVRELAARIGPLAATSANRHGEPTPETALAVAEVFGAELPLVLDGGRCSGVPSTVVDVSGPEPRVLRAGAVSAEALLGAG